MRKKRNIKNTHHTERLITKKFELENLISRINSNSKVKKCR